MASIEHALSHGGGSEVSDRTAASILWNEMGTKIFFFSTDPRSAASRVEDLCPYRHGLFASLPQLRPLSTLAPGECYAALSDGRFERRQLEPVLPRAVERAPALRLVPPSSGPPAVSAAHPSPFNGRTLMSANSIPSDTLGHCRWCGARVGAGSFRDLDSFREYQVAAACQSCQDAMYLGTSDEGCRGLPRVCPPPMRSACAPPCSARHLGEGRRPDRVRAASSGPRG